MPNYSIDYTFCTDLNQFTPEARLKSWIWQNKFLREGFDAKKYYRENLAQFGFIISSLHLWNKETIDLLDLTDLKRKKKYNMLKIDVLLDCILDNIKKELQI